MTDYKDDSIWLMKGDCLERMKEIESGSVDMVLADVPYGTTQCKWDSVIPLEPMWEQLKRIIKPRGAIVMTACQPFTSALGASNLKYLRYSWVWEKPHTGQLNAKRMPLKSIEDVLVFYASQPTYNPQFTFGDPYVRARGVGGSSAECYGQQRRHTTVSDGRRYPKQRLNFSNREGNVHPTQKPVALMEYLIKTYTNEGETVLDFTMGSGTTGVAARNLGRKFIGIEMDEHYFEVANGRILGDK